MVKTDKQILQLLKEEDPLTLMEIADMLEKKPKTIFRALRKLFQKGKIDCDPRTKQYTLAKEEEE